MCGDSNKGERVSSAPYLRSWSVFLACALLQCWVSATGNLCPESLSAQTIRGTLLQRGTDNPISLGFVALLTESGDSITSTITNREGQFSLTSPVPGNFFLLAAALGHRETTVGVFELGEDGELTVDFRIPVEALTLDGLLVQADRISQLPALVRNGFSRRMQQGVGRFITPEEIENSSATRTSDLFLGMVGVRVIGNRVLVRAIQEHCSPQIYLDGLSLNTDADLPVDVIVPLETLAAAEVYRRAAEVPLQYGGTGAACGVILFWTKEGG